MSFYRLVTHYLAPIEKLHLLRRDRVKAVHHPAGNRHSAYIVRLKMLDRRTYLYSFILHKRVQ